MTYHKAACFKALVVLLNLNSLNTVTKIAQALDITQAAAKKLTQGKIADIEDTQIIRWTCKIILNKLGHTNV